MVVFDEPKVQQDIEDMATQSAYDELIACEQLEQYDVMDICINHGLENGELIVKNQHPWSQGVL